MFSSAIELIHSPPEDAIVEFEVAEIVPCERRNAIAEADAEFGERAGQPPAAPFWVVARSLHDFDRSNNAAAVVQQPLSSLATRRAHDFARQLLSTAQAPPAAWIRTQSLRASPPV